ncbi:MAG: NUDIX domain-containing protein, partial [Halobacteria archaeon]|nr:NUDIX domain-containing protein [Halobacteria archaeon]
MNDGRERTHVVTCFLRNSGDVLLLRRSDEVGTYSGRWSGVSGYVESDIDVDVGTEEDGVTETTDEDAWREVEEETGLSDGVSLVRRGEPFEFTDD